LAETEFPPQNVPDHAVGVALTDQLEDVPLRHEPPVQDRLELLAHEVDVVGAPPVPPLAGRPEDLLAPAADRHRNDLDRPLEPVRAALATLAELVNKNETAGVMSLVERLLGRSRRRGVDPHLRGPGRWLRSPAGEAFGVRRVGRGEHGRALEILGVNAPLLLSDSRIRCATS
jgi:hypothetical protein